jgi:hypothetical protein
MSAPAPAIDVFDGMNPPSSMYTRSVHAAVRVSFSPQHAIGLCEVV